MQYPYPVLKNDDLSFLNAVAVELSNCTCTSGEQKLAAALTRLLQSHADLQHYADQVQAKRKARVEELREKSEQNG
ncbi:hypothetical protein H1O16_gp181 [Burkholderia phage BcepSaruman]|uniref:Uncharacterized protein n=1 Tax=Burkholderia phage BcepSaruman TaxID=2530032 RepID=A0A4D5ZCA6_9CAUD|nr:hypothetical protein H1O16_gp181 [Burkholderia phage BcepSaruman]QBX06594.1 hypothetical protein BcepSaruman_181 [Burkholderia phage BcepSaruman]